MPPLRRFFAAITMPLERERHAFASFRAFYADIAADDILIAATAFTFDLPRRFIAAIA